MDILSARFIFLLLYGLAEGNNPLIKWQILNPPISFGDDIVMFCNTSVAENCCTNTATWMKDFDIIVHHGASINSSKYTQKQHSNGFSLIITNFNEEDINHQYTCLYDFFSYSEVLKLNPNVMRYEPNKEEIKTNFSMSDNFIVAVVLIEMIYPTPECNFVVNGEMTATKVTIFEEPRNRLFFKMKIHLECEINKTKCIDSINVAINCSVGGDDMGIKENTTINCPDTTTAYFSNDVLKEKTTILPITLASILTSCIAVVMMLIIWKLKGNTCKAKLSNIEGGQLQSISSEERCPLLCWKHRSLISEDSEMSPLLPKHELSESKSLVSINKITETEMKSQGTSHEHRCTTNTETLHVENNRMIVWVISDYNAFLEALNNKMRVKGVWRDINNARDGNDINFETTKPSSCSSGYQSSNDSKRSSRSSTPPAQKTRDVATVVIYAILHDNVYIQRLATDIGINLARGRMPIGRLDTCTCLFPSVTRKGDMWVIGPAQKWTDVIKMIRYYVLYDKSHIQKLVTNYRINSFREQRSKSIEKLSSTSCVPEISDVSTADITDAIKASSSFPSWGSKNKCRIISRTISINL